MGQQEPFVRTRTSSVTGM